MNNMTMNTINTVDISTEWLIQKLEGHRCMGKKGEANLYNVSMLEFGRPILLVSVRTRVMMGDSKFLEERI